MFCPKCKTEYEDWVKECVECNILLVKNLPVETSKSDMELVEIFKSISSQEIHFVKSILEAEEIEAFVTGFSSSYLDQVVGSEIKLFVSEKNQHRALEIIKNYISNQQPLDYAEYKSFKKKVCTYGGKSFYLARRTSRLLAALVDGIFYSTLCIYLTLRRFSFPLTFLGIIGSTAILLLQVIFLSADGQSLGKKLFKIRIIDIDTGENGGFVPNVLLRIIVNGFLAVIPLYELIDILFIFRNDRRCIHDLLARTCVVEANS